MPLSGNVIAITGKLSMPRKKLVDIIVSKGGTVASSVTKKTTHLICAEKSGTKYNKAVKLGVKVVQEQYVHDAIAVAGANANASTNAGGGGQTKRKNPVPDALSPAKKKVKASKMSKTSNTSNSDPLVKKVADFISSMIASNSNLDKQKIFKEQLSGKNATKDLVELLKIIYTDQLTFGVTSNNIVNFEQNKWKDEYYVKSPGLLDYVGKLVSAELTGHNALKVAVSLIKDNPNYRDTLLLVFNKDIKIRFGLKQANKVIPKFAPEFNVSLGKLYDDKTKKLLDSDDSDWYMSKKLDGVRCLTIIKDQPKGAPPKVELYSRQGLQFTTLEKVSQEIQKYWPKMKKSFPKGTNSVVLDGEMCVLKEDGSEDFKLIMKEIRKKIIKLINPDISFLIC